MSTRKQKLQAIEKNLVETTDVALLRRDLNTMVHTLTQTLRNVLVIVQDLSEAVEGISRTGTTTTIEGNVQATGDVIGHAGPKKKTPAKKPATKRTVKKTINLEPK